MPYRNPNNYVKYSRAWPRRWPRPSPTAPSGPTSSTTSPTARRTSRPRRRRSGPRPTGKVDGFVSAVGSGGTLGGVSDGLKAKRKDIQIALADPPGAALYSWYTTGELKAEGSSITEGIGQGRVTKNLEGADRRSRLPDPGREVGCRSASSCSSTRGCAWAARPASMLPAPSASPRSSGPATPSSPCSAIYGTRYQSKLFDPGLPALEEPARAASG